MTRRVIFYLSVLLLIFLTGCGRSNHEIQEQRRLAEDMVYAAYMAKDYPRIITLVDSFKTEGNFSEGKACYWLGYAYDRMMQKRMAELYWRTGIAAVQNSTKDDDVRVYAGICNRLTGLLSTWTEYEAALKVAVPAVERLRSLKCDTTSEYTNMLIYIGCCQSHFGLNENSNAILEEGYRAQLNYIKKNPHATSYRDAIIGVINICYTFMETGDYNQALAWLDKYAKLIEEYEKQKDAKKDYAEKQWARYNIYRARTLEGLGRKEEAIEAYREFRKSEFFQTAEGKILASHYLKLAGLWQEAADNLKSMETLMKEYGVDYSLENIQQMLIKKYEVNKMAGRMDSARDVSVKIVEHLDSAITLARLAEVQESAAVHQKELEITAENESYQRQRTIGRMASLVITIVILLVYIFVRHRNQTRLEKAHNDLKVAYDQLEETTSIKERMESELRIASDIQMSMIPDVFPQKEGLDMYASMITAKEVGGDLYNYFLKDNKLYFCIGDVSGKGVPASLFMAQSTRLFHTLATQQLQPAEICNHMNRELSGEDNVNGMFVTLFLGLLDLKTGHLTFCNAGHNPPVIDAGTPEAAFIDMQPNAPIGLWVELDYEQEEIESIMGRAFFIYTDGLNEAEDAQQNQFGDDRLLDILRSNQYETARGMVTKLAKDVEQHRNGAEPNDDLTMLCLKFSK